MALIASRMATLDQVMLPYLVQGDGRSVYAAYRERGLIALTSGSES